MMKDFSIDLRQHLLRQMAFSTATFGPGARHEGVSDHIRRELIEIKEAATVEGTFMFGDDRALTAQAHADMDAALEWVDVVILAMDGLTRSLLAANMSRDDAARHACIMISEKQARNEDRRWPDWRTADTSKALEHVGPPLPSGIRAVMQRLLIGARDAGASGRLQFGVGRGAYALALEETGGVPGMLGCSILREVDLGDNVVQINDGEVNLGEDTVKWKD